MKKRIPTALFILFLFLLFGCATKNRPIDEEERAGIKRDFESGALRVTCESIGCSASMGRNQKSMRDLYDQKKWNDLVVLVANVGSANNLSYFFLGRSAEELGFSNNARIYYKEALSVRTKCKWGVIDNCVGLDVPEEAEEGIERIDSKEGRLRGEAVVDSRAYRIRNKVVKNIDEYKKVTNFNGPVVREQEYCPVFIRASQDERSGVTEYQAYVSDLYYGEWRHYSEAYDINGNKLNFVHIRKDVVECPKGVGCRLIEDIGVSFRRPYLNSVLEKGMSFKVSGKGGSLLCSVPAYYIQGILLAVPPDVEKTVGNSPGLVSEPAQGGSPRAKSRR